MAAVVSAIRRPACEGLSKFSAEVADCVSMQVGWESKIWGRTRLITRNAACELHEIEAVKGGYCSIHKHQTKWNGFQVLSGRLLIREWHREMECETIIEAGQYVAVRPGVKHQFEALTDCHALELYWAEYTPDDIERDTVGGMRGS